MCDGRRFQADGAATEKELLESWQLNRGTLASNSDSGRPERRESALSRLHSAAFCGSPILRCGNRLLFSTLYKLVDSQYVHVDCTSLGRRLAVVPGA